MLTTLPPAELPPPSRRSRIAPAIVAFALLGGAACLVVPRGWEAQSLFSIENDPVQIARLTSGAVAKTAMVERRVIVATF